jgi:hypothetical protein
MTLSASRGVEWADEVVDQYLLDHPADAHLVFELTWRGAPTALAADRLSRLLTVNSLTTGMVAMLMYGRWPRRYFQRTKADGRGFWRGSPLPPTKTTARSLLISWPALAPTKSEERSSASTCPARGVARHRCVMLESPNDLRLSLDPRSGNHFARGHTTPRSTYEHRKNASGSARQRKTFAIDGPQQRQAPVI